jgi:flagellar basal body P-ring formation protein FlgA
MSRLSKTIILIALAAIFVANANAAITVTLKGAALLQPGDMRLGDIATITSEQDGQAKQLAALKMGKAPLPGNSRAITRTTVAMYMKRSGIPVAKVKWNGPTYCLARIETLVVNGTSIGKAAMDYLKLLPIFQGDGVEMQIERTPKNIILPAKGATTEMKVTSNAVSKPWGRMTVFVSIKRGKKTVATQTVTVSVSCTKQVCFLSREVVKGDRLNQADIEIRTLKFGPNSPDRPYVYNKKFAIGKMLRGNLAKGRPLEVGMLVNPMAVKKGDSVAVTIKSGNMEISTRGISLASGQIGDQVWIKIMPRGKRTRCIIVKEGEVKLPMLGDF